MGLRNLVVSSIALLAAACAHYGADLVPGNSTIEQVKGSMGEPTMVRQYSDGTDALWYSKLPYGRQNWVAVVNKDGILVSFDQRLTDKYISQIRPSASTADNVLDLLGPPFRRTPFPFKPGEAWEYQLPTTPEYQTLYVEIAPDGMVMKLYKLYDRDLKNKFP